MGVSSTHWGSKQHWNHGRKMQCWVSTAAGRGLIIIVDADKNENQRKRIKDNKTPDERQRDDKTSESVRSTKIASFSQHILVWRPRSGGLGLTSQNFWMIKAYTVTRNTLDCDQSNYSSRTVFAHIPIEFCQTAISAIRSADLENPTVEPNMKWIGRPLADMAIWNFPKCEVGLSVGPHYILILTLISYTPLRYDRNVAREE